MSETDPISFHATIQKEDKFIFVAIPFAPRVVWGAKPRYHVRGSINGMAVRGTLGVFGQEYFLRLSVAWLRNSGIEVGADITVQLSCAGDAREDDKQP
jgi:hypothetical protein